MGKSSFKLVKSSFPKNKTQRKAKFIKLHQETQRYLNDIGNKYVLLANKTVDGWKSPPGFEYKVSFPGQSVLRLRVKITGSKKNRDKWHYADAGVPGRVINARKSAFLRYRRDYKASTRRGVIGSGPNSRSGPWVTTKSVNWPGIEARGFRDMIEGQLEPHVKQLAKRLEKHAA